MLFLIPRDKVVRAGTLFLCNLINFKFPSIKKRFLIRGKVISFERKRVESYGYAIYVSD